MRPPHWLKIKQRNTTLHVSMGDRWLATADQHDTHTAHVIPLNDHVQHDDAGTDCICGPTIEHFTANDDGDAWLVTHHSLDGREQAE